MAKGYDRTAIEDVLWHMETLKPFNQTEMKVFGNLFLDFCILGGMPAVLGSISKKAPLRVRLTFKSSF